MHKLRIYLADDHPLVQEGLCSLLADQMDLEVVGTATDGTTALADLLGIRPSPDVAVLDISLPGLTGFEVARRLRQQVPQVKVLTLTVHEDPNYLRELLQAGAVGYVLKRTAAEDLIRAIRVVASGGLYLAPSLAAQVVGGGLQDRMLPPRKSPALSEREEEVARLVAAGHTNKEIANRLKISVKTVETYKARSMEKLGFYSRAELVRHALNSGWLRGEDSSTSIAQPNS